MDAGASALLFGRRAEPGLVAAEHLPGKTADRMVLFWRRGDRVETTMEPFRPFVWLASPETLRGGPTPAEVEPLAGPGTLRALARFPTWAALETAVRWLHKTTKRSPTDREAPYAFVNDPVQQHLMDSGHTIGHGLDYDGLRRMQLDIETATAEGYEFPNPDREEDRIIAIGLADNTGWCELIRGDELDEAEMLERFAARVRERDPDVIEGHNIFSFDLDYLIRRAARHGVRLPLGRDGSLPSVRPGRFVAAERAASYPRIDIFGRTVLDTYFLAQIYDVSHRSLPGLGLKEIARHFGFARAGREHIEGPEVGRVFRRDPERVLRYLADDLQETADLAMRLAPVYLAQARMVPMSLQNMSLRGTAAKIDALMLREYLARRAAIPQPQPPRPFEGGLTEVYERGVVRDVHHCDVRSLYPSLMLADRIRPASDHLDVFLGLLERLREVRLAAKDRMRSAATPRARAFEEAMQSSFKILINSFYGYLGFEGARFNDFDAAERVAARGRELLRAMVAAIREGGGRPVEIDTDGVFFVPPPGDAAQLEQFRARVRSVLPPGVELEFDSVWPAMFSYRAKNYALRGADGELLLTGAALRSRGLEPYLRDFIRDWVEHKLDGRDAEIPALVDRYRRALIRHEWPLERLARTERLGEAPETYAAKRAAGSRARSAAAELALASGRPYRAGDQVSYYVTGTRKSVPIHSNARLLADARPDQRDENVAYYVARLEELVARLEAAEGGETEEDEPSDTGGARTARRDRQREATE
ncbi:MAG: DNA polymerase II [Kiritimatiellae bacterium]|nr:DNA polymerase II [Kiritimatiellia bacterium]